MTVALQSQKCKFMMCARSLPENANSSYPSVLGQRINHGDTKEAQESHGDLQHAFAFHDDLL